MTSKILINKRLNLVVSTEVSIGPIRIHSVPVSRDVFETFYEELGEVFTKSFGESSSAHMALSAPQLAYAALKKSSRAKGTWDTVKSGLINEIVRLSNVVFIGDKGWESLPMDIAVKRGILDEDAESEVLSALIFFTAITFVSPKNMAQGFLDMASALRSWELTSFNFTEFKNGLPTLTEEETSVMKTSSRVPSVT